MRFKKEAYADDESLIAKEDEVIETEIADISNEILEKKVKEYYIGNTRMAEGRRNDVRKLLEDKVVKRIGRKGKYLVDKLFELIEGTIQVAKVNERGQIEKYYKRPPDLNAIIYALDRVLGKPKQVNVQASFSLAKLLVETNNKNNGNRSNDNEEVSAVASVFRGEGLELNAPAR